MKNHNALHVLEESKHLKMKKNKNCTSLLNIKITISLRNEKKNQVHLNHFIALEAANSPVSCFIADEKKSKYRTDVEQTAFRFCHTLAFFK